MRRGFRKKEEGVNRRNRGHWMEGNWGLFFFNI